MSSLSRRWVSIGVSLALRCDSSEDLADTDIVGISFYLTDTGLRGRVGAYSVASSICLCQPIAEHRDELVGASPR